MPDNTINFTNQGNASIYGKQVGIDKQYNYNSEQQKTLAEAAQEIQDLLEQLAKKYPTNTLSQKGIVATKAVEAIEKNPNMKERIVSAIQSSGITALQEAVDNPLFNIMSSFIEGLLNP
ncbi:MAG: hypothetical protein F6K18_18785 [Okeania sp. SIO2C2]|uniref:hypothetical protein n=1 Tax=Okeania sp. SIO2C2 TaxID=2607787 RepID=UPI0013B6E3DC|nr:hypothetical protein [Okeania sp. SIO2C2]NEP88716.1 hypothetical protein [Okeania sp. SIO2C2]